MLIGISSCLLSCFLGCPFADCFYCPATEHQKERERDAAESIKRLKASSEASYRMVRQLKLQVREQTQLMASKQAELDAARKGSNNASGGGGGPAIDKDQYSYGVRSSSSQGNHHDSGITPPRRNSISGLRRATPSPASGAGGIVPVVSRAVVKSLQRKLSKEIEIDVRRAEYEQQLKSEMEKVKELQQERKDQASQLKAFELLLHRSGQNTDALSDSELRTMRELQEAVEDLNAEIEYLDGSVSQSRKRLAKYNSDKGGEGSSVVGSGGTGGSGRSTTDKWSAAESKAVLPELVVSGILFICTFLV